MFRNITYIDKRLDKEIVNRVGKSFSLGQRWRMKGVGSPRLLVHDTSAEIAQYLGVNEDLNYCFVELRERGLIIRFRSRLETFGLILPYYRLGFYQNGTQWSFHGEGHLVKATSTIAGKSANRFKMNLLEQKALFQGDYGPFASK